MEKFTRRDWSQGLVPRTVHTKRFEEQVAGTCPKDSNWFKFVELVAGTKLSFLRPDFEAKMQFITRWDLSLRLSVVAETCRRDQTWCPRE